MFDTSKELEIIKDRMISAGISDEEANSLLSPLMKELERRVCGLVWEHKNSSIPKMNGRLPAFMRQDDKCIISGNGTNNVLIEGENLYALMGLQYTHIDDNGKGLIDIIYIDPPYNIDASGVAYNDKFECSEWLSIMEIRLKLARNLLADDGIILISIDDRYVSELRMLCNDIFGKCGTSFMIESSVIAGRRRVPAMQGSVVKTAEYVLAYRKDRESKIIRNLTYDYIRGFDVHYSKVISNGKIVQLKQLMESTEVISDEFKKHGLKVSLNNLTSLIEISTVVKDWLYSAEISENLYRPDDREKLDETEIEYPKNELFKINNKWYVKNNNGVIYNVFRYADRIGKCDDYFANYGERQVRGNLWKGFSSDGGNLDKEGGVSFKSGKKPVRLLKQLLWSVGKDNATVLDFFAGSGTTGQAVLELNDEKGGNRNFILCTNNEIGKDASEQAKKDGVEPGSEKWLDYGVCRSITYQRMKNVFDKRQDNLFYYLIDDSSIDCATEEETLSEIIKKFISYVSIKENAFIVTDNESWSLLKGSNNNEVLVITDTGLTLRDIKKTMRKCFSEKCSSKKVYCKVDERELQDEIELIPYPKEIMSVLVARRKDIIKGELR